jgi:hypothetical protein
MKRLGVIVPAFVFMLVFGAAVIPHVVRAEDNQETQQSEVEKEAAKKAAEQAKEQAKKLAEQRKEAEQQRQEAEKKAQEAQREALKKQSEAVQEQEKKGDEARTEAFKKACEDKREHFKTRMETVITAVQHRGETLNTLVERIKSYVASNNLTVANYQQLLTDIETQKSLAQTVAQAAKEEGGSFDCTDRSTAKESLTGVSDAVKQEVDAISGYKTAVKNLITAVKAAAGSTSNAQ